MPSAGLKMPETLARKIEELSRGLPGISAIGVSLERANRSPSTPASGPMFRSLTPMPSIARGSAFCPAGGDWTGYNRVVTFAHRYDQLPVGSNWWIRSKGIGADRQNALPAKARRLGRCAVASVGGFASDAAAGADMHGQEHRLSPAERAGGHPRRNRQPARTARRAGHRPMGWRGICRRAGPRATPRPKCRPSPREWNWE